MPRILNCYTTQGNGSYQKDMAMKHRIFVFAGALLLVLVSGCHTSARHASQLNAPPPQEIYIGQAFSAAPPVSPPPVYLVPSTEEYAEIEENTFKQVNNAPLSTFSIDVDTASYANVRRILNDSQLPIADAVRIEELINYFPYDYPQPAESDGPFSVTTEVGPCLWNPAHRLARIGLKGLEMDAEDRPRANLVFLLDVSGSMQPDNKLPLVKRALRLLVPQLHPEDRLGIVTYAGQAGIALKSIRCTENNRKHILDVIEGLGAGGSTHGAAGLKTAYEMVNEEFRKNGINRVILCTDGDFNVGVTDEDELVEVITDNAKNGVFFTVLGFGMGNLKDDRLETLADKGNGAYGYIDSLTEARKVFLEEMTGTLVTIAKDVKIQVEFNPARVAGYRLVGYENRMLTAEEFNDDTKDAGEIGAGHTVTALYEIVPAGQEIPGVNIDELRYQQTQPT
ncbi:MAG: von Willebrand factor type A domain-containing protein, partial [Candidatus Hydrogenedentes bacterium]|nr:von Willebrand factor type A domain-containing protein [Candidatus Hydrogenedentota bacterium]